MDNRDSREARSQQYCEKDIPARTKRSRENCENGRETARLKKKGLRMKIRKSQERSWKEFCNSVVYDPWGLPYREVMKKMHRPTSELDAPGRTDAIMKGLFPAHPVRKKTELPEMIATPPPFSVDEIRAAEKRLENGKALGPDGVPDEVSKQFIKHRPDIFLKSFNQCLRNGGSPIRWKRTGLVLIKKGGDKPIG